MKVTLIQAPAWGIDTPPLNLAVLASVLKKNGHKVNVIDINNELYHKTDSKYKAKWGSGDFLAWEDRNYVERFFAENKGIIDLILKQKSLIDSAVVGFSITSSTKLASMELADKIKFLDKNKLIVFGGYLCVRQRQAGHFLNEKNVDAVILGEAEATFPDFLNKLEKNKKISFCKGVIYKKGPDIIDCGDRPVIKDLDKLPFPDFGVFPLDKYKNFHKIPMRASRGCVLECVNCYLDYSWHEFRTMSGTRIFETVKYLAKKTGLNSIFFYDAILNGDMNVLMEFCELMAKYQRRAKTRISWGGTAVPLPELSRKAILKMKTAGCDYLYYGIQSGSQRVLDKMGRKFNILAAQRVIRDSHEAGIFTHVSFRVGFPLETEEDFKKTIEFVKRNSNYIDAISVPPVFDIPGNTDIYRDFKKFGVLSPAGGNYWRTKNGNTYPERLRRQEALGRTAAKLKIKGAEPELSAFMSRKSLDLERYRKYLKELKKAGTCLKKHAGAVPVNSWQVIN
ncbi:MAG: B12-binding domain-containing radical SAM protein [Elusimicrobia bacterium]|nr:B12-binding domain-containing radical SAM protein [Candidatus Liberimonas magnetica]